MCLADQTDPIAPCPTGSKTRYFSATIVPVRSVLGGGRDTILTLSPSARDPCEQQDGRGEREQRPHDPSEHREPGPPERAPGAPVAADADGVRARSPFGQHRAIAADRAIAAGAGAGGRSPAVNAPRVPPTVFVVELELLRHRTSVAFRCFDGKQTLSDPRTRARARARSRSTGRSLKRLGHGYVYGHGHGHVYGG